MYCQECMYERACKDNPEFKVLCLERQESANKLTYNDYDDDDETPPKRQLTWYVARDKSIGMHDTDLFFHTSKPIRENSFWGSDIATPIKIELFKELTWKDEPIPVILVAEKQLDTLIKAAKKVYDNRYERSFIVKPLQEELQEALKSFIKD